MTLTLIVSDNCEACNRSKIALNNIQSVKPEIDVEIIHIKLFKDKRIYITPALLIDSAFFSYGEIDEQKLLLKLN